MIKKSTAFGFVALLFMFGSILNFMTQNFFMGPMLLFASSLCFIIVNKYEHLENYHYEPLTRLMMLRRK